MLEGVVACWDLVVVRVRVSTAHVKPHFFIKSTKQNSIPHSETKQLFAWRLFDAINPDKTAG
jgi:hypothetical protein